MDAGGLAHRHLGEGDPTGWFEEVYAAAEQPREVPWARLRPDPKLVAWLEQPDLEVAGSDVLVVGCGFGDDAAELARRGCRVTAFDVSATAVGQARRRFPDADVDWRVADLFDPPDAWRHGFGLVVEIRTVQSLPGEVREAAMRQIAGFVAPGGWLLHVGLLATAEDIARAASGPPWPLAPVELAAYRESGLERVALAHPPDPDAVMEVRLTLRRPADDGRD